MSGKWEFGVLRDARDGMKFDYIRELASDRDNRTLDVIQNIDPNNFSVDANGTVFYGDYKVIDYANQGIANMSNFAASNFEKLDPDIMETILKRKFPKESKMVRFWQEDDGTYSVRSFLSDKYAPISTEKSIDELCNSISEEDRKNLRIVKASSDAVGFSAEIVDITTDFDISKLGDPGPVPDDITFAGWKLTGDDTGKAAQKIFSYLWRLVCNNGSSVVDRELSARAIHKGSALFSGKVLSADDWKEFIAEATKERIKVIDTETASKKFAKMVNRPSLKIFEKAWWSLSDKTQPMRVEIPAPEDLLEAVIQETNLKFFRRIDLAEAFGFAANSATSRKERDIAQAYSGRLLTESLEEVAPTLASLLI